jgi:hypothetical protein
VAAQAMTVWKQPKPAPSGCRAPPSPVPPPRQERRVYAALEFGHFARQRRAGISAQGNALGSPSRNPHPPCKGGGSCFSPKRLRHAARMSCALAGRKRRVGPVFPGCYPGLICCALSARALRLGWRATEMSKLERRAKTPLRAPARSCRCAPAYSLDFRRHP